MICHKINTTRGGSNTHSPNWLKNKKATINPINKNYNKYFQYFPTHALNHQELGKDSERIIKIKPFIGKCN